MSKIKATAVVVSTWWPLAWTSLIKNDYPARKFCPGGGGSNFDNIFLVDDGREDPNTTISGRSLACQRNTILMGVPKYSSLQ